MRAFVEFVRKHWELVSAIAMLLIGLGAAQQRVGGLEQRIGWVEDSHPDATATLVQQLAKDENAINIELAGIRTDVSGARADIAFIRGELSQSGGDFLGSSGLRQQGGR
jgi:hypothetical protein